MESARTIPGAQILVCFVDFGRHSLVDQIEFPDFFIRLWLGNRAVRLFPLHQLAMRVAGGGLSIIQYVHAARKILREIGIILDCTAGCIGRGCSLSVPCSTLELANVLVGE